MGGKKMEQEIVSITRKIWSVVDWPQWGSDSITAPNKQKIPDLFPESFLVLKGAFFPGEIMTFCCCCCWVGFISPQKNGIFPKHAQIFLDHLFQWFLPLKIASEHLLLETPLTLMTHPLKVPWVKQQMNFPSQTHRKVFPLWFIFFFFCLKLELTVDWPSFNLCLGPCLDSDTTSPAMPIRSECKYIHWAKCGTWTNSRIYRVTERGNAPTWECSYRNRI